MRYALIIFLLITLQQTASSQNLSSLDKDGLLDLLNKSNDTVYVVNFWATWCSPCVAEIGYFEELHQTFKNEKIKVILVNLDFPNQVERRVLPFLIEKGITADVANMTEMDYNSWISEVDQAWSGALPATKIFDRDNSVFIGRELNKSELFGEVNKIFNKN